MYERRSSTNSANMDISTLNKTSPENLDSSYSPGISRYGRSHKPKMQDDYVSTDKKVSAYLKLSPGNQMQYFNMHKEPKKKASPKKLEGSVTADGTPKRGRPRKTPIKSSIGDESMMRTVLKAEPQDPSSPVDGCEWMVGDLAWARVGGHPFWPCVIAIDPVHKIFTKTIRKGRNMVSQRWIHVQFFGDNGRRSWLNSTAIMSFQGREAFVQLGDTILAGMRRKDPKQTSAFVIKPAVVQVWEKAVQEAEDLANSSRDERIAFFATHFPPLPSFQLARNDLIEKILDQPEPVLKTRGRKRKADQSPSEEQIKRKQMKLELSEEAAKASEPIVEDALLSSTPRTIADRKKRQALLMQLARSNQSTPVTPSSPAPDSAMVQPETLPMLKLTPLKRPANSEPTTLSVEKKKPKKKYVKKKISADFQAFCSKSFGRVADDHPELNEKEVNKYVLKMWNEMEETQKARAPIHPHTVMRFGSFHPKYKGRLMTGEEKDESESIGETSEEVEGSEYIEEEVRSSKSSSPAPIAAAIQKSTSTKRKDCKYLFSGAKSEKVCQICERTGDTVKCRGPCQGYYHPDCVINPPVTPTEFMPTINKKAKKRGRPKKNLDQSLSSSDTSQPEELIENQRILLKEEDSKLAVELVTEVEKVEQNGVIGKGEDSESSALVEVIETEVKNLSKVRKGSKDSESGEEGEGFRCKDCQDGRTQPCFVCHEYVQRKTGEAKLYRCITAYCGKVYHEECLKPWPQTTWRTNGNGKGCERGVLTCPQHTCHTCASDNPSVIKARYSNDKLVRCLRCPTTYHYGNYCLPAGSEILTNTQIICPQHYQPARKGFTNHVNAAWCFICASGGSLICCDLCPTSFHADCLNISMPPDGSYVCEDCLTGRFPLYGEIVWVKLGSYRWWPAEILYPALIPDNILNLPHVRGEFAVRFFGSHDHYWVNRGRVFLYQDGDTAGKGSYKKSSVDHMFERAVREASEAQRKYLEEKATRDAETRPGMKPPNYVKLKTNKPVGNVRTMEMNVSSLTPCECDPSSEAPCAPESDCLNRILMVECNPLVCPAGEKCHNQSFEKRQYPPLQPYQTQGRGWGLKTLVPLKKGDFVIEYVGEMIDEEEYKKRLSHMHKNNEQNFYFLTIDKDRMLDAGPKGNVARFMNHSCQPNCETQKWTVNGDTRVGLFAVCDIPANMELVFNYNLESIGSDKKPCMCGAPNCSGFIGVKANKSQDKEETKEKKTVKKKKLAVVSKTHDEACFVCGVGGELLLCDGKHCTKGFHVSCLGKKQRPQGYWLCPWHQCNICNKGRVRRCTYCLNSFCQEHSEGNIRLDDVKGLICNNHDEEKSANIIEDETQVNNIAIKMDSAKTKDTLMEVDIDSSENSTTGSINDAADSVIKLELTNNNVVKPENTPERRSRRSKSYTGSKTNIDTVVNGSIEKINRCRVRPSSVDDKLIVSYEKTECDSNLNPNQDVPPLSKYKIKKSMKELLNQIINNLPIEESNLEIVKEDQKRENDQTDVVKQSELQENTNEGEDAVEEDLKNGNAEKDVVIHSELQKHTNKGEDIGEETQKSGNTERGVGIQSEPRENTNEGEDVGVTEAEKEGGELDNQSLEMENNESNIGLKEIENEVVGINKSKSKENLNTVDQNSTYAEDQNDYARNSELGKKVNSTNFETEETNSTDATYLLTSCEALIENNVLTKEPKTESKCVNSSENKGITITDSVHQNIDIKAIAESETQAKSYENIKEDQFITNKSGVLNHIENKISVDELTSKVDMGRSTQDDYITEGTNDVSIENVSEISENHDLNKLTKFNNDDICDENLENETKPFNEADIDNILENSKNIESLTSTKILGVDEPVDDFELSYSECSNDKLYKSVHNSESSIEMKLTECSTPTENEKVTKTKEEVNSKNELASCIDQSNAMEVA